MSLGVGIFASVVLILAVYHAGFRKVLFWSAGVIAVLTLLGAGGYFAYDRYTTWQTERAAQKQKAATDKGIQTCMNRLGQQPHGLFKDAGGIPVGEDVAACTAYPDMGIPPPPPGFVPDSLPPGYMLDVNGKVVPISPDSPIEPHSARKGAGPIDLSAGLVPKKDARRVLKANVTCDVIVYDRDKYAGGDREAINSLHTSDVVEYIGDSPDGSAIIRVHGRRGYVVDLPGCIEVIQ